jgi:hypothetical protein
VSAWIVLGGVLIAVLASLRVTVSEPRVHVRWLEGLSEGERASLERRYELRAGIPVEGTPSTWRYDLGDLSRENIRALVDDPAVADTAYIDRKALTSEGRGIRVTMWYPYNDLFERPSQLLRLHRSLWLLLAGAVLLSAARLASSSRRPKIAIATLLLVGLVAVALPFEPSFVTMGGSSDHTRSRGDFESWFAGRVRYEKHLSQVILLQLYLRSGPENSAPERAVIAFSRFGTAWFVLSALAVGFLERWSALALRYIGLALLAPSALLYFGWREFGYLSLNAATVPLLVRGLREGGGRLEAGSALAGLGAALHGSGLVSLAGAWMAALGTPGRLTDRGSRLLCVAAWGTAAYLGWVAVYVIVLHLNITPDPGPTAVGAWRPWAVDDIRVGRVAAAILSATGARDVLMSAWIVGAPLLFVVLSRWRRYPHEVRTAMWYMPPSILFLVFRWPFEGIGGGMDLVVAGFPALYALTWVCAHDTKSTNAAAVLLASAHYAFWRAVLDERFEP